MSVEPEHGAKFVKVVELGVVGIVTNADVRGLGGRLIGGGASLGRVEMVAVEIEMGVGMQGHRALIESGVGSAKATGIVVVEIVTKAGVAVPPSEAVKHVRGVEMADVGIAK